MALTQDPGTGAGAAHARLKDEGWGTNTLCTQCDERHPDCAKIAGGGVCRFRYPDWMHILQQLLDSHAAALSAAETALVFEHMELVSIRTRILG